MIIKLGIIGFGGMGKWHAFISLHNLLGTCQRKV